MCAWSGGTFTRANPTWVSDSNNLIGIEATRHDAQDNDFTTGINQCLNKDGSNSATGNLNLGGYLPTNIGAGTAAAPAICAGNDVDTGMFSAAANQIGIATNGAERVRIDNTGKVGIGTTAPASDLHIQASPSASTTKEYIRITNNTAADTITSRIAFNNYNGIASAIDSIQNAGTNFQSQLVFSTQTGSGMTEKMRIDSGGKIGFGTASPTSFYEFTRSANDNGTSLGLVNSNSGSSASCTLHFGNNVSSTAAGIIYNSSANTTNAGANGMIIFQNAGSGKIRMQAVSGGVDLTSGATSWAAVSDERLKKNVQPLAYGLNELLQINPIRFDYKTDESDDSKRIGFIAQNVKPLVPEAVTGDEESFYGLSATELIPALVNSIKELNAKVEALEARIAALEA